MTDEKKPTKERTQTIQFKALGIVPEGKEDRKAFLTVIRGGGADLGKSVVIEGLIMMGRDYDCDLKITDSGVSWHHARITAKGSEVYELEDLGSTNGVRVNGRQIKGPWELVENEKIFLGNTVIRFTLADEMDVGFHQEVAQLVGTDPLTGLESKRRFDHGLDQALLSSQSIGQSLAVLMMDMDGIKSINDTHGHLFGSHSIKTAGEIIGSVVGKSGHACRFGGDEFTVFLPNHDHQTAKVVAEEIRSKIECAEMQKDGIPLKPTISIGIAVFPDDGQTVLDLIAAADQALYRAKARGKNTVCH